jgi:hypothetical protein
MQGSSPEECWFTIVFYKHKNTAQQPAATNQTKGEFLLDTVVATKTGAQHDPASWLF